MSYVAVTLEGGLFPPDLLDRIAAGDAEGQRPEDFGLGSRRLSDEIQSAFSDVRSYWQAFQARLAHSRESRTTLTRETWVIPFLERLDFTDLTFQRAAVSVGGDTYAISHRAGDAPDAPPVHVVAVDQDLDRRAEGSRRSPHATVQEYLNRSDAVWGLVTNGERLRLLRDSARLSRPTYLEFNLRAILEGNLYSEFVLLYRLLHRSRFPKGAADAGHCRLERYYQQGLDEGGRVRERLREGVEAALQELGTALLAHPQSGKLREALRTGRLTPDRYYRELLRLVYRLLFLFVAEERRLLLQPDPALAARQEVYRRYYSVSRLRDRCERPFEGDRYPDLWQGLLAAFRLFRDSDTAAALGLSPLDGELFGPDGCPNLEEAGCENARLLTAVRHLSTFHDGKVRRRVNYAALDVEELGSVYESLLEYRPHVTLDPVPRFELVAGSERKQTGSYYTPPALVRELIESALVPVLEERLAAAATQKEREDAVLGLRVCDPAAGSGHFLLAAARRLARELTKVRTGEADTAGEPYRQALRDVIRRCLYAVDRNPLAVDLCKVALWIEGHNAGLPLSFLDHHVKCGDSLLGVFDLRVLAAGIPDGAYNPVTGDDRAAAAGYKRRNRQERGGQLRLDGRRADLPRDLAERFDALAGMGDGTPEEYHAKQAAYQALRRGGDWWTLKVACDLWTAAFFSPLAPARPGEPELVPTTDALRSYLAQPKAADGRLVGHAAGLADRHRFFHWPLEFPEVFAAGGFDVVLGNPPWERIKLQEQEFFAGRDPEIARAPNKAARERLIRRLPETNPALAAEFAAAKHAAEAGSKFIRASGRFPLTGAGDVNTYAVFAETMRRLLAPGGRAGFIVPTGIATDDTTKAFFRDLMERRSLAGLYDFENRERLFPAVDSRMKFSLVTLAGAGRPVPQGAEFAFFLHRPEELREEGRRFVLTAEDVALVNPNTRTCPIFRTARDAELTTAVYRRVPVLVRDGDPAGNPWGIRFATMFHMSNDSGLFRTAEHLQREGWTLRGNVFQRGDQRYLPLYEAKLIHQFDHRWATYAAPAGGAGDGADGVRDLTEAEKRDPACLPLPRYWVPAVEVDGRLAGRWDRGWLLGWRDITNSTNERTVIASVLPRVGVGHKFPLMLPYEATSEQASCLLATLNSLALDFIARQKIGGTSLTYFYLKQFPIPDLRVFAEPCPWSSGQSTAAWLLPRVLELTYTAWDLAPFARDLGYGGPPFRWDPERRFLLRCELDAAFFHLYGLDREDVDYVMETFPIVKRKDEAAHGEYRTKRVILEIYRAMAEAAARGEPYRTRLDPPPADPRAAHGAVEVS